MVEKPKAQHIRVKPETHNKYSIAQGLYVAKYGKKIKLQDVADEAIELYIKSLKG